MEVDNAIEEILKQGESQSWIRIDNQSGLFETNKLTQLDESKFQLKLEDYEEFNFQIPTDSSILGEHNLTSVDCSTDKIQLGTFDGELITSPLKNPKITSNDEGEEDTKKGCHFMGVNQVKILPSNEVCISLGSEGIMKVWSLPTNIESGEYVRSFNDRITCFEPMGKGRNVITGTRTGHVNLYDLGSNKVVWSGRRIKNLADPINCLKVIDLSKGVYIEHENMVEIQDKVVLVGHKSGYVSIWNMNNRLSLGEFDTKSEVTSIDYLDGDVIIGNTLGQVQLYKYDFEEVKASMNWCTTVEVSLESEDDVSVTKLKVVNNEIIVLSQNRLVLLNENGCYLRQFIGYDYKLNDFCTYEPQENKFKLFVVGKYGHLGRYQL